MLQLLPVPLIVLALTSGATVTLARPLDDANAGLDALNSSNNAEAVRLLTKALESGALKRSDRELALLKRAEAYSKEGEVAKARVDVEGALRLDPQDEEALMLHQTLASSSVRHLFWTYKFDPPGSQGRDWEQRSEATWDEVYEKGAVTHFRVIGQESVDGAAGVEVENDSADIIVFVPDRNASQARYGDWLRFRRPNDPDDQWAFLGEFTEEPARFYP